MAWFSAIMFIVSLGVQAAQASRARAAARRAAEAADLAKGFQIVTSGEPTPIPIVYGRAKVGGSRVYHKTMSTYTVPSNVNTLIANGGGKVMLATGPIVPINPPAGWVRAYFQAAGNIDVEPIANTPTGVAPTIVEKTGYEGGNYSFGIAATATEAASLGGHDPS